MTPQPLERFDLSSRALDAFRVFGCSYILTQGSNGTGSVSMLGYDNLSGGFSLGNGSGRKGWWAVADIVVGYLLFVLFSNVGSSPAGPLAQ